MANGSKKFYNEYVNAKIKPYTVHSICQMTRHACKHSLHIPDFMESDSFLRNPESHVWDDMNEEPAAVPIDVFIVDKLLASRLLKGKTATFLYPKYRGSAPIRI